MANTSLKISVKQPVGLSFSDCYQKSNDMTKEKALEVLNEIKFAKENSPYVYIGSERVVALQVAIELLEQDLKFECPTCEKWCGDPDCKPKHLWNELP